MKIMSLLLIFISAFSYSQNKSGESAKEKQSSPLFKRNPPKVNFIKPKVDSIEYKMLVKKVENPEHYLMMVKKPAALMVQIPNSQHKPVKINLNRLHLDESK
ncbi:hypothetical protein [Chryseobacterium koreense]|uniref:hypothetical protein n=1 Tax=Chryseobacterium koreense TaxID=232216 RepID=UPI0026F10F31|nr:hypothetical protein [Chryseobacterium koreense]